MNGVSLKIYKLKLLHMLMLMPILCRMNSDSELHVFNAKTQSTCLWADVQFTNGEVEMCFKLVSIRVFKEMSISKFLMFH